MSKSQLKRLAIQKGDVLDRLCTEWPAEWSLQPKTVDDRKCVIEIQRMKADAADEVKRLRQQRNALLEALEESRSSVKFDFITYEKKSRAYGNIGPTGETMHAMAEAEANRLHKLLEKIDAAIAKCKEE